MAIAVAAALTAAIAGYALAPNEIVVGLCFLLPLVGAAAASWIGALRAPRPARLVPRLVAAGISLSVLGDVLWIVVYRLGGDTDLTIADPSWLLSYVVLGASLGVVLTRAGAGRRFDADLLIDAVTIGVVTLLVLWRVSVGAIVTDDSVSPLVRVVWAAYPVLDALLLALVIRVLLSARGRAAIHGWFVPGVLLWLAADISNLRAAEHGVAAAVAAAAWMTAPVLMCTATWRRPGALAPLPTASGASRIGVQLLIAIGPLPVPATIELIADHRGLPDRPAQLLVGTAALITLTFIRIWRLLLAEQHHLQELARARDDALAASEAKSLFLANMSHELRTPLTTVLAANEILEDTPLSEPQLRLVDRTQRAGRRLMSLLESLLDFSRVEAGQARLEQIAYDPHELLVEVVDAHLARAHQRAVRLVLELDPGLPRQLVGDPLRVGQVVGNLVDNAVKFTHDGRVRVHAAPADDDAGTVRIAVSDTGIGIHRDHLEAVFSSFTQVDGSVTRRYEGSGLGLAICKELAELMGGSVSVTSELGSGSTFEVRLPLRTAQDRGAA